MTRRITEAEKCGKSILRAFKVLNKRLAEAATHDIAVEVERLDNGTFKPRLSFETTMELELSEDDD